MGIFVYISPGYTVWQNILAGTLPLCIGAVLDMLLGDSHQLPHPVRWIGWLISAVENRMHRAKGHPRREFLQGLLTAAIVITLSAGLPLLLLFLAYRMHIALGVLLEGIFCYYLLAARSLRDESMKVYDALCAAGEEGVPPSGRLIRARQAVSMIVGRDTDKLDETGIIKAAVETVAENTSDGVTAPLFYMAVGGAVLGFFYKAVNTLDSMIGYRNEQYQNFGAFAAHLDDILNYIPSRLTALLMIGAAYILKMDGRQAGTVWRRDRRKHKSPNSAQTESVCAGALNIMLAGDAYYFGELHRKDTIGDDIRPVEAEDIRRANRLMYGTAAMMLFLSLIFRGLVAAFLCR
ncbi:MAG: adenosylcobinamide-phosphate synthase CbiB [Lachnospiraceae bacterium]|nr:adenosylcobinamide-phosphate synthase CbiB [Lachnospiraceae bacterium]